MRRNNSLVSTNKLLLKKIKNLNCIAYKLSLSDCFLSSLIKFIPDVLLSCVYLLQK